MNTTIRPQFITALCFACALGLIAHVATQPAPAPVAVAQPDAISTFESAIHSESRAGCIEQYGSDMADICNETYDR